jgi:hypothetical protein
MIAMVLQGLFFVPANYLQQDHWLLTDKEAVDLAKAIWGVLKTLPKNQNKKINKFLTEYAPLVKLATVGGVIIWKKMSATLEIARLKKENAELRSKQSSNTNRGFTNGASAGFPNEWGGVPIG